MSKHHSIVIVGAGTAGISAAARLCNQPNPPDVAIIDPAKTHYYQPLWTLVGGGVFDKESTARPQEDYIPAGATWIQEAVKGFDPEHKAVLLQSGEAVTYDNLIVAAGIQLDWAKITGLQENLGKYGICSNYSYESVDSTWENLRNFKGGRAIFTFPATPIKCAGAPQKIMWLAEHWFRKQGLREKSEVIFASAGAGIFGVPRYARALSKLAQERGVKSHYRHNLIALRPEKREAVFEHLDGGEELTLKYDMIHVTPPQSAPDFIKQSALADAAGWVEVDKFTLQHARYPEIFSAGDCSSLPCSKTGAAVRKQVPVLVDNLMAWRRGEPLRAKYDGYASCPLVTGYGRLILAEFGYDGAIMETFPFDQSQERYSMYALKAYGLPNMYWNGMLRGRM
jgi:sulfide:quinone oxidoreductase